MHDLVQQGLTLLRGMWRWRWLGLAVSWVVGAVAATVVLNMPNQYEASARIWVDTQSVLKPLMAGLAVQPNVDQQISILSRTLINRPNMERLVRMADLDHGVKSKEEQEKLIDALMRTLHIRSLGRDNLYQLGFRDPQPEKAKRVVQSLASIFVESSLGSKRRDTDSAKQFIEEQIKIYESKLMEAESRLKEFKLRNLALSTGDGKDAFGRIGELGNSMNQARLELREAEKSRDSLKRQLATEDPNLPAGVTSEGVVVASEIDSRLSALKKNLDLLLQRYTEQHPDVTGTKRIIADLEAQRLQEIAARKAAAAAKPSAGAVTSSTNPVYQKIKIALAEAEANVASLEARVAEYDARYARFKGSLKLMPEIEAEFANLNRDYEVHKANYQTLVSRRESAVMSGQMEASSAMAEFRLIDPPRVSPQPVAPNRPLLFFFALLGALAAGAATSFLANQIRPAFQDAVSLREHTGLPIIGTVSLIVSEPMRRKELRGVMGFIAGVVTLLGAYGAGIVLLFLTATRSGAA